MTVEQQILAIQNRITLLEGRQPKKENVKIVKKLNRKLRSLTSK